EKELIRSEDRLRRLVEGTDVVFWERDSSADRFTYVGPQVVELLGHPVEDWYQRNFWLEHVHEEDRERVDLWRQEASQCGNGQEIEYRMVRADQRIVSLRDIGHIARDEDGALMFQGFILDITERQRAR